MVNCQLDMRIVMLMCVLSLPVSMTYPHLNLYLYTDWNIQQRNSAIKLTKSIYDFRDWSAVSHWHGWQPSGSACVPQEEKKTSTAILHTCSGRCRFVKMCGLHAFYYCFYILGW